MPDIHHSIGGSNAHIWIECPASPLLSRLVPPFDAGPAAARGTRIHALAEKIYNGTTTFAEDDFEEVAIAQRYVTAIKNKFQNLPIKIEHYVKLMTLDAGGTIDCIVWDEDAKILYVLDLKTGKQEVSPECNWQLLFYAMCALHTPGYDMIHPDHIYLGIYQNELLKWWPIPFNVYETRRLMMIDAINKIMSSYVQALPGEHCKYCKGKKACVRYIETKPVKVTVVEQPKKKDEITQW